MEALSEFGLRRARAGVARRGGGVVSIMLLVVVVLLLRGGVVVILCRSSCWFGLLCGSRKEKEEGQSIKHKPRKPSNGTVGTTG